MAGSRRPHFLASLYFGVTRTPAFVVHVLGRACEDSRVSWLQVVDPQEVT